MTPLQLALLDLIRKKASTMIAVASIAVCVACGGLLLRLSILSGSRFSTLVNGPDAVIGAKSGGIEILLESLNLEGPYPDFIPGQLYQTLKHSIQFEDGTHYDPASLRRIVPIVIFGHYSNLLVLGTDQGFFQQPMRDDAPTLIAGRWFGPGEEVVVGSRVARENGILVGDELPVTAWTSRDNPHPTVFQLRVVGIFQAGSSAWNRACFSSMAEAQRVFRLASGSPDSTSNKDVLHFILAYLRPGGFRSIAGLINRRSVAELISVPEQKARLEELTGTGIRLGLMMTTLVLLLSGLSVAGVMIARFDAMKMQIAVLRALGFSLSEIGKWLLWEGSILAFSASVIGAMAEMIFFPVIRSLLGSALPSDSVAPNHFYYAAPFWVATVIAISVAVFIPFFRMTRQDPHSSLKGQ